MTAGSLVYPGEWQRGGRGLTAEIEGLTADAVEREISALPEAWAPYRLLAVTKRKESKHYVEVVRVAEAGQLDERRSEDGQWNYFLWSPSLTPELNEPLETEYVDTRAAGVLSLNGLIGIQYRPQRKGRELPTGIGCVHKIRSEAGEVVHHSEYEKIYRSLLRSLRKAST
jgi:hypothetical protein